mmetsp:Transcript_53860/g.61287  ORF Transcript_53860/g.61287 Transcript_53860/m.61287 type:complete len:327 (+) Transcript_53860:177-1157(+)
MMMNTDTNNDTPPEWKKKKGFFPTIVAAVALVSVAGVSKYVRQPASLRISSPAMASSEVSENNDSLSFLDTLNLSGPSGNQMTHYWDCEQFACSAKQGPVKKTIFTCDGDGQNPHANCYGDSPKKGSAACSSFVPIIEGSTLYGLAAVNRGLSDALGQCGNCYSMNVNNSGNNSVKKAVVMVTNTGDLPNGAAFDFLVPGGGFGANDNCDNMKGWNIKGVGCESYDTPTCTKYGGLHHKAQCGVAFSGDNQAKKACEDVLFKVFPYQQNPKFRNNLQISNIQSVTCPSQLTKKAETCNCDFDCGKLCGEPYNECHCAALQNVCPSK